MEDRPRIDGRHIAWVVVASGVAALIAAVVSLATSAAPAAERWTLVFLVGVASLFGLTGAVLAGKRPSNPLLWIIASVGFLATVSVAIQYAYSPPSTALDSSMVYVGNGLFFLGLALFVCFFPLLFPDGELAGTSARALASLGALSTALTALWGALRFNEDYRAAYWPFGAVTDGSPAAGVFGVAGIIVVLVVGGGLVNLIGRYRRGTPDLRRRIRAPLMVVLVWLPFFLVVNVLVEGSWVGQTFGFAIQLALPVLLAVAIVVAVTRYGLYEIERIFSRTISYAVVAGLLGLVYASGAVWLPQLLPLHSDLAVAGSTLVAATMFNPLRRRVQSTMDRRFNRNRYDTESVFGEMRASLRNEIDSIRIGGILEAASADALHPSMSAIWFVETG